MWASGVCLRSTARFEKQTPYPLPRILLWHSHPSALLNYFKYLGPSYNHERFNLKRAPCNQGDGRLLTCHSARDSAGDYAAQLTSYQRFNNGRMPGKPNIIDIRTVLFLVYSRLHPISGGIYSLKGGYWALRILGGSLKFLNSQETKHIQSSAAVGSASSGNCCGDSCWFVGAHFTEATLTPWGPQSR